MKKTTVRLLALAALALGAAEAAHAQHSAPRSLWVEVRGGGALPSGDFGSGLQTGVATDASLTFHFTPELGVYAGYAYSRFEDSESQSEGLHATRHGPAAGLRLSLPTEVLPVDPYVHVGALYHRIALHGDDVLSDAEFRSALGYEVGLRVGVPLSPRLQLTPGVTYSGLSTDFELDGRSYILALNALRLDVGLRLGL